GVTSTITLTEVLTKPRRLGDVELENTYRKILLQTRNILILPVVPVIAERAADLRARYNLKTPDALQIATALDAGCDAFLTNDAGIQRVTDLKILIVSELE
ncbi:MAG: PIN domain-containing protein, partial [Anaerolineae bacterium]|nr:PIN domain-containing protein [Anaerolineae bacterium]